MQNFFLEMFYFSLFLSLYKMIYLSSYICIVFIAFEESLAKLR